MISDGKPIMYEKTFLQDVANQDFAKYAVEPRFAIAPPVSVHTLCWLQIVLFCIDSFQYCCR